MLTSTSIKTLHKDVEGLKFFRIPKMVRLKLKLYISYLHHFLMRDTMFSTWLHTSTLISPMNHNYTNEYILEQLRTDPSHVAQINIRYGGIGTNHNNFDGLTSKFLTNSGPARCRSGNYCHSNTMHKLFLIL